MQFMFFICCDSSFNPPETMESETVQWVEEMQSRKVRMTGDRLVPTKDAVTVQIRKGKVNLTNGPFAVTEIKIAGFDLIDCASKEEAIQIALKHPMARLGTIEIRQLWVE
jgi:hypothetical protein